MQSTPDLNLPWSITHHTPNFEHTPLAPSMAPSIYSHLIGCKWSKWESNNSLIVINQFHQPDRPICPTLNHSQVFVRKFHCLVRLCYALRLSEVQFIYISGISVRFFWQSKKNVSVSPSQKSTHGCGI